MRKRHASQYANFGSLLPNLKNYRTYIKNQSKEKSGYKIKELSNHFLSIIINLKELFKT